MDETRVQDTFGGLIRCDVLVPCANQQEVVVKFDSISEVVVVAEVVRCQELHLYPTFISSVFEDVGSAGIRVSPRSSNHQGVAVHIQLPAESIIGCGVACRDQPTQLSESRTIEAPAGCTTGFLIVIRATCANEVPGGSEALAEE